MIASTTDSVSPSLSISDLYDANSQPITIQALGGNRNNDKDFTDPTTTTTSATMEKQPKKSSSSSSIASSMTGAVSSALSVPTALKGLLYSNATNPSSPLIPTNNNKMTMTSATQHHQHHDTPDPSTADIEDSSSSENEDLAAGGWLDAKRRSGIRLVYGLLGGGGNSTGSTATVYRSLDEEEENEEIQSDDKISSHMRTDNRKSENDTSKDVAPTLFPYEEPLEGRTRTNFRKYFVLPQSEKLEAGKINNSENIGSLK